MQPLAREDPSHIGPYRLIARLGSGGMGRVYLARSEGGRTVAVKRVHADFALHPTFRLRFTREVAAARKVGGEWTAPVLDADVKARNPWVATGYVPGPPLDKVVDGGFGPLPPASVHVLAHRLALALQAIHEAGLVHRDLKPANILLTVDGPRVIDFGIARGYTTSLGDSLTEQGTVLGTPAFMSPEQARGETVTRASDVFSLGSVLTYAATGRPPFRGSEPLNLMYHITYEAPDLTGVPDELVDLVSRCLAKEPEDRPSVRELLDLTRHAVARAWLPGELLARLGRDAARLLDAEARLAEAEPLTPVSVPAHATTFPDIRGFEAMERATDARDLLDVPGAGIRPPSVRPTPEPPEPPRWVPLGVSAAVLVAMGLLLTLLPGLWSGNGDGDPLAGSWGGPVSIWGQEGYAQIKVPETVSAGDVVGFVMSQDDVTCWGRSTVLSREDRTLVLWGSVFDAAVPEDFSEQCAPGGRLTFSPDGESLRWHWGEVGALSSEDPAFTLTYGHVSDRVPAIYTGTWNSGDGLHLTIGQGTIEAAEISGVDTRSGKYCVWSAKVLELSKGEHHSLVYDFVTIDAAVSDGTCRPDGPHRLNVSEDGELVTRTPYEGNQGKSTRRSPEAVDLRLVG
ncbi:serine/threonine-protein kinase [Streptomyces caniscabiei]|uniref:serine/threonine-protein kinase n=1 Tax=Streptomyces caniscabiei TaxID=2746961 RepID=UPI000A3B7DD4|nr:serine/threonine-protein kinase [Streptomyces caniscabiei]